MVTAIMPGFLFLPPWWASLRTEYVSHHLLLPDLENILFFFTNSSTYENTCYLKYHHPLLSGILFVYPKSAGKNDIEVLRGEDLSKLGGD